jgi:hypothetical protein
LLARSGSLQFGSVGRGRSATHPRGVGSRHAGRRLVRMSLNPTEIVP